MDEIGVDGNRARVRGSYAALVEAVAETKLSTLSLARDRELSFGSDYHPMQDSKEQNSCEIQDVKYTF